MLDIMYIEKFRTFFVFIKNGKTIVNITLIKLLIKLRLVFEMHFRNEIKKFLLLQLRKTLYLHHRAVKLTK